MTEYQASERRGCRIMGISRSLLHYCPNTARDIPVVEVLQKLAHQYPVYGFGLMFNKLITVECKTGISRLSLTEA